ncbi:PQQ-dependent dehydrogenase, methanol/ethanol family [Sphingomonas crocodyli]|nr:PQQ-dependent dehydrogenase, methanol/ethanol family [Sphingomonas crocodyli]
MRQIGRGMLAGVVAAGLAMGAVAATKKGAVSDIGWPMHGFNTGEDRFSPLTGIDKANVSRLGLAWYHEFDTDRGQEATPIVVGDRLYVTTAWSKVGAFDAATGKQLWFFDPKVPGQRGFDACCDVVNRGAAVDGDRLFVGTIDGRLIALNRHTGKQLWSVQTTDPTKPYTITGAPRVVRGKVIIGNGGAEYGVRGYVTAYDAATGKQVWRFYTVPGDPAKGPDGAASDPQMAEAAKTWFGKWYDMGGGGTVWDSIVYDADLNRLYIGVGNGGPHNQGVRSEGKGDNLFIGSVVALDPDTGKYIWHYQETPGDTWDYTSTQTIILADLPIDGVNRKVILHAPKNAFFYVIDRQTGKPISATPYSKQTWATGVDMATGRPIEAPGARWFNSEKPFPLLPGPNGAHNWYPMAYSPKQRLAYIPTTENSLSPLSPPKEFTFRPGSWNMGTNLTTGKLPDDPAIIKKVAASRTGALVAWDPIANKQKWRVDYPTNFNGGLLVTASDLLFQGTATGHFLAYGADDGAKLWDSGDVGTGIMAGPVTYTVKGVQYVAVMAGIGGSAISSGILAPQQGRRNGRLLVFRLDGKAKLPPYQPIEYPDFRAPMPQAAAEVLEKGRVAYANNCMVCHGPSADGGILPDLRRSPLIAEKASFDAVLIDGALAPNGMISFKGKLSEEEVEAVRLYLMQRSAERK